MIMPKMCLDDHDKDVLSWKFGTWIGGMIFKLPETRDGVKKKGKRGETMRIFRKKGR